MNTIIFHVVNIWNWFVNAQWLQQIEAAVVIAGVPSLVFKFLFYRPILRIEFIEKETLFEVPDITTQKSSYWLHLTCKNIGWVEAKKTNGYIRKVYEYNSLTKQYLEESNFRSQLILAWAHENDFEPKNILPRDKRNLDICFLIQGDSRLYLRTKQIPNGTLKVLNPGEYIFEIVISGDNVDRPTKFFLPVKWNGIWKQLYKSKFHIQSFKLYDTKTIVKSFQFN